MWKILYLKTRLAYIAYYKSIIKLLYTFIRQRITWEHLGCRQLALFTCPLNCGDTWSFYNSKVFLRNIKSTCVTQLLLNCFLSWIRFVKMFIFSSFYQVCVCVLIYLHFVGTLHCVCLTFSQTCLDCFLILIVYVHFSIIVDPFR